MPKTNRNSFEYNYTHVKERLRERHDLSISEKEYKDLCNEYVKGRLTIVSEEPSNNQIVFKKNFKGKSIHFVWCTKRERATTALP